MVNIPHGSSSAATPASSETIWAQDQKPSQTAINPQLYTHNYFFWKVEEKENERNSQQMTDQTPNRSCPEQQTSV